MRIRNEAAKKAVELRVNIMTALILVTWLDDERESKSLYTPHNHPVNTILYDFKICCMKYHIWNFNPKFLI